MLDGAVLDAGEVDALNTEPNGALGLSQKAVELAAQEGVIAPFERSAIPATPTSPAAERAWGRLSDDNLVERPSNLIDARPGMFFLCKRCIEAWLYRAGCANAFRVHSSPSATANPSTTPQKNGRSSVSTVSLILW